MVKKGKLEETPALLDTLAEDVPHEKINHKTYETGECRKQRAVAPSALIVSASPVEGPC